jgi:hypothetical protein
MRQHQAVPRLCPRPADLLQIRHAGSNTLTLRSTVGTAACAMAAGLTDKLMVKSGWRR